MIQINIRVATAMVALLAILSRSCSAPVFASNDAGETHRKDLFGKVTVGINNDVGGKLLVHCKSKDNDLGEHVVADKQTYSFSFGLSVFGNTLFFCGVTKLQVPNRKTYLFTAYSYTRDGVGFLGGRCDNSCDWSIEPHQIKGWNDDVKIFDIIYNW